MMLPVVAMVVAALTATSLQDLAVPVGPPPLGVRITSPLGRIGIPGKVRIVAQVHATPGAILSPVQFFVDGVLLGEDRDGPPFAAEWEDINPFEPRSIEVSVADSRGNVARDAIALKPLEVVEVAEVMSVLMEASVQDKAGHSVGNVKPGDFTVLEDGVPQALELVRKEAMATTFALLIDSSQSMSRRMDFVKEAASRLSGYLAPQDRMLIVPFAKQLNPVTGPTNDPLTVNQAISSIVPKGGTAILDALIELAPRLQNVEGRRAIVLVTDGYDEHSEKPFDAALAAVKGANATVYVVGIGGSAGISLKGERLLRKLASETGGRAFLPSREEELSSIHGLLAADIHNRYLITYTPKNQTVDGSWRAVSVSTNEPSYTVRTRAGYFAPKPPPVRPALEFTISSGQGQPSDISADDLMVVEDGVAQSVETFQEALSPVSVVLALDSSGSMKKSADAATTAARRFVEALKPEDRLATVLFADRAELTHELSVDRKAAAKAIDSYVASGGTALYDALTSSLSRLRDVEGRRVVVVVTDGRDEDNPGTGPGSVSTFEGVLNDLKQIDAVIYGVGLGPNVDRSVLQTLAEKSGGEAYFPDDVSGLDEQYYRIVEHLRRRWVLGYTSTNPKRNGEWRQVEITSKSRGAVVKSRGGYFAPGK
jgi:Ca-activated chloride channel homolog